MPSGKTSLNLLWLCVCLCVSMAPARANETISLQLKWKNAFQFAGFYMAVEKGYYAQHGLNVKLIEGGPDKNPINYVLGGAGRYGITDTGIVLARAKGKPVKALAAIFQHSPLVLAVLKGSGIRAFSDLHGKRVMMQSGFMGAAILAALRKAGVEDGDFIRQDTSFNLHDLIDGKTDAFSVYLTDQPHELDRLGVHYRLLRPSDYGIDFYGDVLITSDAELLRHPARVQAFIDASIQGWDYALDHIDETINLILDKYNTQHFSSDQLYFEAYKTSEMVLKDVVPLGYMSPGRWQKIASTYSRLGLIKPDFSVRSMLYIPEAGIREMLSHYRWPLAFAGLVLLLLIFALQTVLLRRMVKGRTRDLERSEIRFRTLVANIPGAVFRCRRDAADTMDFISQDIEVISGYPASDFLPGGSRTLRSIVHPDDSQRLHEAFAGNSEQGHAYTVEYRIRCADDLERWVMEVGQIGQGRSPEKIWIDGCIFDISDRKRAEKLRESITSILQMVAVETNLDHILERIVNIYEQRYPGLMASILLLRENRLYPGVAPNLPEAYNAAVTGLEIGPMVGACGTAAYSGERVISENIETDPRWSAYAEFVLPLGLRACWSEPIIGTTGEVLGTFAIYADHTRIPAEDEIDDISQAAKLTALAIERDRNLQRLSNLSRAIEQSSEIITIADREGRLEYVNPALTAVTGYSPEEAIGQNLDLLSINVPNENLKAMQQARQQGKPWRGKISEQRKDGSTYPAMMTISPVRNDEGEITHHIAIHEDLSQLQQMEEQFYQSQKMESLGTLVGGIAHDFNNMLAGINGNLFLAKREADEQPGMLDKLENIEQLSMRAADMIKQLLTFASRDYVSKQPLSLTPFLKETLKLHRVTIPENIELSLDIDGDLTVSADVTQLQQAMLNLITNARDAVEDVPHPAIRIAVRQVIPDKAFLAQHPGSKKHPYARLSVTDNGHGIAAASLGQIFEPFYTTKEVGKGTGLGLSMVFGTVNSHNGFVEVDSKPGKGSCFHVYLPLLASGRRALPASRPVIEEGRGETILLADDEPEVLDATEKVLQKLGYVVISAADGEEALAVFNRLAERIDLILTDVVMPHMGGFELARQARSLKADIPVIFATGYGKHQATEGQSQLNNSCILDKPFAIERLAAALRGMLLPGNPQAEANSRSE